MLFPCTGNSYRNQTAEGWVRQMERGADEALGHFRRVQEATRASFEELPESLPVGAHPGPDITKESTS